MNVRRQRYFVAAIIAASDALATDACGVSFRAEENHLKGKWKRTEKKQQQHIERKSAAHQQQLNNP